MTILSVDDSSIIRRIVSMSVGVLGYTFAGVGDGFEALEFLEQKHDEVVLILLDCNMPGMSGFELLEQLKSDERYRDIPVMMVTTESEQESIVRAIKGGAVNYLVKPFTVDDLAIKIMECMGGAPDA